MDIVGKQTIAAPRDAVWQALNDPQVLQRCLPGCESVERTQADEFRVVIKTVIGPLRARFQGVLRMADVQAPQSCTMHFEGQGGAVGFGKGTSQVQLAETPDGTELRYEAKAQIGGKLAQVGSRLIDSVAKKMADDFFKALREQLAPPPEAAPAASPALPQVASQAMPAPLPEPAPMPAARSPQAAPDRPLVPAWWLAPAAALGAALAIAGARFLH